MSYPLYTSHAYLWPLLSPLEAYESEMAQWCALLEEHGTRPVRRMLDLGSGGGHHLYHLANALPDLQEGIACDLSSEMLEVLKGLLPGFETLTADMTSLRLERRFDLVTVHDSFCYLSRIEQVRALFEVIREHLEPGGLSLVKLEARAEDFAGPYRYLTTFEDEQRELTLTHYEWDPEPDDGWLEVVYLFLERAGGRLNTREERHRLGLFPGPEILQQAETCGLTGSFHPVERWDEERENLLLMLRRGED
ncbi:MAG: class I SAM-dependent methyltransferase [Vulcanimicrobiota bacterium]